MGSWNTYFGLHWAWVLIVVGAVGSPLFFWKSGRQFYGTLLCFMGIALVSFAWIVDRKTSDFMWFTFCEFPGRINYRMQELRLGSTRGQIGFEHKILYCPGMDLTDTLKEYQERWVLFLNRDTKVTLEKLHFNRGMSAPMINFEGGGFQVLSESDAPVAGMLYYPRLWALVLPDWFIIVLLAVYPAWLATRFRDTRWYRRRHNLCLRCGYSLQGLAAAATCPECGTAKNQLDTKLGTETPAID